MGDLIQGPRGRVGAQAGEFLTTGLCGLEKKGPRRGVHLGAKLGSAGGPTFHAALGHAGNVAVQESFVNRVRPRRLRHRIGHDPLPALATHSILSHGHRDQVDCKESQAGHDTCSHQGHWVSQRGTCCGRIFTLSDCSFPQDRLWWSKKSAALQELFLEAPWCLASFLMPRPLLTDNDATRGAAPQRGASLRMGTEGLLQSLHSNGLPLS